MIRLPRRTTGLLRGSPISLSASVRSRTTLASSSSQLYFEQKDSAMSSPGDLTPAERTILDSAIPANWIYQGQMAVLWQDATARPVIQKMWDQEKRHLIVMNALQEQHRVRPSVMLEVAKVVGWGLGAVTALMGREAAMACTEAVETAIGEHYDDQLRDLESLNSSHPSIPVLKDLIRELRDEELEHLDTAVLHNSQRAPAHALLSAVIGAGCTVAIRICKRI
ncbi:hypothetical protein BS47DRAFT_1376424 [Hydnum rufescens UP504]|uniref:5-demethoxyubiquinone hydroxylase, mitochondrial n=1 Tax=Hydnum rufescens UP504 TaxID=1448309 RepID=A0A9P6B037_9AGAM|nr:hypothetical protein BS47DRAFT_1376424 [Hydnum rufescens UP504]